MIRIISGSWPLFFGFAIIMVGNGLQGILLGVRATLEGFDTVTIGLIMSLYYVGYLAGSFYVPKMVSRVGHIRVFTALASLASAAVLLPGLYLEEWFWALTRSLSGFAFAGLYIVVESWLNDTSTTKTRGKIFGVYQIITYGGMMAGQLLLNIANPEQIDLFVITSTMVSLAILPICLSTRPAPGFQEPDHLSLKQLFKISPLGLAGTFAAGLGSGSIFGLGAVYTSLIGFDIAQISSFMALFIFGGVASQIPVAWFSDNYDRRKVLIVMAFMASLAAGLCTLMAPDAFQLNIAIFLLGALALPIYGLALSHLTDHLTPKQYVAGSSSAILTNGLGAAIGPLFISIIIKFMGDNAYFLIIGSVFMGLFLYGLYRTRKRKTVPLDQQKTHVTIPLRPTPISMTITEEGHAILKELKDEE